MRSFLFPFVIVAGSMARAAGPAPDCDALDREARARADALLARLNPYDCCDKTLAECLSDSPPCPLVVRLANNICRRAGGGESDETIERFLTRRARSMMRMGKPKPINLDGLPPAGDPNAPVTAVMYACGRCPYCARITSQLHGAVTNGPLKGKVTLYFKVFPIRGHEYSKESGMALLAARRMGRFWEYLLHLYKRFDEYCPKKQVGWAEELGLDPAEFGRLSRDDGVRKELVASKKEGLKYKVDATPTLFIAGHKYEGELSIDEVTDVLEEAYENARR